MNNLLISKQLKKILNILKENTYNSIDYFVLIENQNKTCKDNIDLSLDKFKTFLIALFRILKKHYENDFIFEAFMEMEKMILEDLKKNEEAEEKYCFNGKYITDIGIRFLKKNKQLYKHMPRDLQIQ